MSRFIGYFLMSGFCLMGACLFVMLVGILAWHLAWHVYRDPMRDTITGGVLLFVSVSMLLALIFKAAEDREKGRKKRYMELVAAFREAGMTAEKADEMAMGVTGYRGYGY